MLCIDYYVACQRKKRANSWNDCHSRVEVSRQQAQKKSCWDFAHASRISSLASGRGGPRYCGEQQSGLKKRLSSPSDLLQAREGLEASLQAREDRAVAAGSQADEKRGGGTRAVVAYELRASKYFVFRPVCCRAVWSRSCSSAWFGLETPKMEMEMAIG
jgi:hypothetical protein